MLLLQGMTRCGGRVETEQRQEVGKKKICQGRSEAQLRKLDSGPYPLVEAKISPSVSFFLEEGSNTY